MAPQKLLLIGVGLFAFAISNPPVEAGIPGTLFIRGDANNDGLLNLADGIAILNYLFGDETVPCQNSADTTDDAQIDITDAISIFSYQFAGGAAPPAPFPDCGVDQTDDPFECFESDCP